MELVPGQEAKWICRFMGQQPVDFRDSASSHLAPALSCLDKNEIHYQVVLLANVTRKEVEEHCLLGGGWQGEEGRIP